MNLPNKLTLLRFALVPVFMVFMYIEHPYSYMIALIVFAAASFTDFLARRVISTQNEAPRTSVCGYKSIFRFLRISSGSVAL